MLTCIREAVDKAKAFLFPYRPHWPFTPIDLLKGYEYWEKRTGEAFGQERLK